MVWFLAFILTLFGFRVVWHTVILFSAKPYMWDMSYRDYDRPNHIWNAAWQFVVFLWALYLWYNLP